MKKKLIISESQYDMLNAYISEASDHQVFVSEIVKYLNNNYKKAVETYREGNEYKKRKVFEIIVDGDIITPKDLLEYLKYKYNVGEGFLKQVIDDWCDDRIVNNSLSKNVSIND